MRLKNEPKPNERFLFVAFAACCIVPMLGIVVLTAVLGVALGPAAAISIGVIAAMTCVAVMVIRHRDHSDHEEGPT